MSKQLVCLCVSEKRAEEFIASKVDAYEIKPDGVFFAVYLIC